MDNIDNQIEEMKKKLEEMTKRQQYLATMRKEADAIKAKPNQLGFYAAKSCREHLQVIIIVANSIDLDKQTESEIISSFNLINSNSWQALKAIERDASERGEA